ncbi:MAG: hypothetical protein QM731_22635 [Chitinophagaceae bacterium]
MTALSFNVVFIIISTLISFVVYLQKHTPLYLRLFPPFLVITVAVEIIGKLLADNGRSNVLLYNCFTTLEFIFYFYVLRSVIENARFRKLIGYLLIVYPAATFINIFFIIPKGYFHSITYAIGCLLMVGICIYYFFELFQLSRSMALVREPAFWICSGLLFYYCCSFPLFAMLNFMSGVSVVLIRNIDYILKYLNVLLYSIFSIAFVCRMKLRKRAAM